jgi:hypothetical protein
MNSRRGSASAIVILAIGMALAAAGALSADMAARRQAFNGHLLRVQGRELALGARGLPPATRMLVQGWALQIAADGAVEARSRAGCYRIAADGREHWSNGVTR